MNPNLFKAILSMDSYNRGYGEGIRLPVVLNSTKIGNATIVSQSDTDTSHDPVKAGFYGIAYQLPSGEKVISYRGTDELAGDGEVGSDAWYGYGVGTWTAEGKQAELAFKFYQSVAGAVDPRTANISLTGHSLGGGLAGLVGSVYIRPTSMFDNMTFETAAQSAYIFSDSKLYDYNPDLKALVYGARDRWAPYVSGLPSSILQTYHMDGEFLGANRTLQISPKTSYSLGVGVDLPGVDSGVLGGGLHSMAALVVRMYADEKDAGGSLKIAQDWKAASKYFWPVMYDGNFARDIGMATVGGKLATDALSDASKIGNYADILRNIIAYSAIDEGTRVFGDTGIRAFYNDANDLGKAVAVLGGSSVLAAKASDISKAFIQFAGQLALNKVALTTALTPVLDGVLTYTNVTNNHSLSVDFTSPVWARSGPSAIYPAYTLVNSLIGNALTAPTTRAVMKTLWGDDTSAAFDRVVFSVLDSGTLVASGTPADGKAFLLVGGNGADILQGSEGRDLFVGTGGNDTLWGQSGNDIFISGLGSDFLYGGYGYDAAIYRGEIVGLTISGNRVTKGSGTDTLDNVEHMVLTNLNDTVTVQGTETLKYWDGGAGRDIFNATGVYAYDMKGARLFNSGGSETVLKNFEEVNLTTNYIYPDETSDLTYSSVTSKLIGSKGSVSFASRNGYTIDYGGASQGAVFRLSNVGATNNVVTIGGKTHTYVDTSYNGKFIGTNYGDIVDIWSRRDLYDAREPTMRFVSGTGNDVVNAGSEGLEYVYTGGNDVIRGVLTRLILGTSIAYSDITSFVRGSGLNGRGLSMTIKGHGTLDIEDLGGGNSFQVFFYSSGGSSIDSRGILKTSAYLGGIPMGLYKNGSIGNDSLTAAPDRAQNLDGWAGNDTLVGSDFVNTISGGSGDDILRGGKGNDFLSGGEGNDSYYYNLGDGSDLIWEGTEYGDDKIILGAGILKSQVTFFSSDDPTPTGQFYVRVGATDRIEIKGGGVEKLIFADGSVIDLTKGLPFTGTTLDENIKGTNYNDTLTGLQGNDGLSGGAGDDVYFFNLGDSSSHILMSPVCDQVVDSSGVDTIEFGVGISRSSVWFERTYFGDIFVHYSPTDVLSISRAIDSSDTYTSNMIEKIKFSDGSIMDISSGVPLSGTAGDDYIYGTVSSDVLSGLSGNDNIYGKAGDDIVDGGLGDDKLDGGSGIDTLSYKTAPSAVNVKLREAWQTFYNTGGGGIDSYYGFENLVGSNFNDTLEGSGISNVIDGGKGNDLIKVWAIAGKADTIIGGDGIDTLMVGDNYTSMSINLGITSSQLVYTGMYLKVSGIENLIGTSANDILIGDSSSNTIQGKAGNDNMDGGSGIDTLSYADAIVGITVNLSFTTPQNTVGAGSDTVKGFENLLGSSYNDTLTGDANANTIEGGLGNDTLNGGAGVDTVSYSKATAAVTVDLSLAISQNTVGAGSDLLSNFENIFGSAFADTLKGNSGANVINGGSGNDVLLGKGGNDILYGGLGADSFKFDVSAVGNIDTVKDFKLAEADKLDIRDLLVGYDPLTKAITDFVECTTSGANTIVKVDRDGAGATYSWQQIAVLENVTGLTDEATLKASGTLIA